MPQLAPVGQPIMPRIPLIISALQPQFMPLAVAKFGSGSDQP
jgi:hypothetical protein